LALLQPHLQDIPLAVGMRLHQAGNPIDYAYFPHSGLVSLLVPYHSGAAVEAGLVGPEGIVDGLATMGVETCFTDATVQVSGHAARIHYPQLREAIARSARLQARVMRHNAALLAQAQQSTACNAVHSGEARVCRWLLEVSDRLDDNRVPATQEALADNLGLRRTTITAIAQKLQASGAIRYRRGYIVITDRQLLASLACECYEQVRRHTQCLVNAPAFGTVLRPADGFPAALHQASASLSGAASEPSRAE
jgi:CRP-like cAMP-binding protein